MVIVILVGGWALILLGVVSFSLARIWRGEQSRRRRQRLRAEEDEALRPLVLQERLGRMANELQVLASRPGFANAHHVRAAQSAYDALLAEACMRAGLPVEVPKRATEQATEDERLREELELASRGWSW